MFDEQTKNRIRAAGFQQVDQDEQECIKAIMNELEQARSRAEMRAKEAEALRLALKNSQADIWVQREMYMAVQGQWGVALRKVYQMASESESAAATQNTMRQS